MPHRAEDIRKLCGLWPPNWLDYTIEGLRLEDATQGAASHWEALLSGENARELEIHLYSDGSASEAEQRSGYGVVVLVKAGVAFALLGIIAEQSHGAQDTPWPTGAPLPLRAEQIGLAVALMWVLQMNQFLWQTPCFIHYDCAAAGEVAQDTLGPADHLGERLHLLELLARDVGRAPIDISHVKAHAGEPWNALADAVAKAAARGWCGNLAPPRDICQLFLDLDLTWASTEHQAAEWGTVPTRDGHFVWHHNGLTPEASPLTPGQLVPTVTAAWTGGPDSSFAIVEATLIAANTSTTRTSWWTWAATLSSSRRPRPSPVYVSPSFISDCRPMLRGTGA